MPLVPLFLISSLFHAWVGWRVLPTLAVAQPVLAGLFGVLLVASALLMPMGFVARRVSRGKAGVVLTWLGLICMGLFSSLFVLTVLRDGLLVAAWAVTWLVGLAGWAGC